MNVDSLKNNSLKKSLINHQLTIGSWVSLPSQSITEIMVQVGFPWLVIDLEHSVIDLETMQNQILTIESYGKVPLVRLSGKDPVQIKRVLDAGAYGIIAPMVNTKAEAELMVKAVKYPPIGNRGVGLARAQGYGIQFERYQNVINDSSIVIIQIEHKNAVENIDEILSVEGIDGLIIGPYDISGSYGILGQLSNSLVLDAENTIIASAERHHVPVGLHVVTPNKKILHDKIQKGFKLIAYGVDQLFFANACQQGMNDLNQELLANH